MKRLLFALLFLLIITPPLQAEACVGKTLLIASSGTPQQEVLAHMLATLIGERTGTTVKVVRFDSAAAVHEKLLKADLDIAVEYAAWARSEVLKQPAVADPAELYKAVREAYTQEMNLVWLAPFGFSESKLGQGGPVARKDTLKKFPALARLIDKLGSRIDDATMQKLEAQAKGKPAADVARTFLKEQKLI